MSGSRPRAVLLDALGTLVALDPPWPALVGQLADRGVAITEAEAREALLAEIAYYRAHHDEARDRPALEDLRDRCAAVLRGALPERARGVRNLRDALLASLRFRAYAEVAPVLAALRDDGVRLVVVSNWDVSLHEVLERTGLAALVDGVLTSAEVGWAKPDPRIFARALELAGVGPGDAWHVGDSPDTDVAGALAAGIAPLLVARDGAAPAVPAGVRVAVDLRALLA